MENNTSIKLTTKPPIGGLKKGIQLSKQNYDEIIKTIDPTKVLNRIGLVIDDSGSMDLEGIKHVHDAVRSFTENCNIKDTSIAVYPLNNASKHLVCDYDLINLYISNIWCSGGTPIYVTLDQLIITEAITRTVLFSDGSPTDSSLLASEIDSYYLLRKGDYALKVIKKFQEKKIPIDAIFIGYKDSQGYKEMQEIARLTDGHFVHFKDTQSLSSSLKYLAPKFRALLANPEIKERIERGEKV